MSHPAPSLPKHCALPSIPALALERGQAHILTPEGEVLAVSLSRAQTLLHKQSVLVCHAPYMRARLEDADFFAFDVLELFAFVHPAKFCVPTPHGLSKVLGLPAPENAEDLPFSLISIAQVLLSDLSKDPYTAKADPLAIAQVMGLNGKGWGWTPFIVSALGQTYVPEEQVSARTAMSIWKQLPEWAENPPEPPPSHFGVTPEETLERLQKLTGFDSESREPQKQYAQTIAKAFAPVENEHAPHIILAEAGTGIGKTLGYLAPASVWAEKNQGTVWISTYTKNLQRQIGQELDRLYPDPTLKNLHVATRKGRENYLCLLNLEDTINGAALSRHITQVIAAGIMARWSVVTSDGDLSGAQFPGWLGSLLGAAFTSGLADKRGECLYAACDHYKKCFVEHATRKAERARLVVANHALVMIQSALSRSDQRLPARYIFDEGHHLFDAADSAFSAHLSGMETRDFRRWVLGGEGSSRTSRTRGLKRRIEDLCEGMKDAEDFLRDILYAAECLTSDNWTRRIKDQSPMGPCEAFLLEVHAQVLARAEGKDREGPYSLETETFPVNDTVKDKARTLKTALKKLQKPMQGLSKLLLQKLAENEGTLAADTKNRMDTISTALERRSTMTLQAWIAMLETLESGNSPPECIDWMEISRENGRAYDVGLHRHVIDPMKPFAESLKPHVQGMVVTSATLRDPTDEQSGEWSGTRKRTGALYLAAQSQTISLPSPFDYAHNTKVFIITDVGKNNLEQVSGAYRALFQTAGGGALGLFTAISRLRAVHDSIAPALEARGIPVYGQHVDSIDIGTLIDMFRENIHACLLGTDAVRDGVDVPGESLRLIVFDRVPWPRPTILHKARREAFARETGQDKKQYDDMMTHLKLKQAFGRLIRRKDDRGAFVILDPSLPSRLLTAFPEGVEIIKTSLSEALAGVRAHLGPDLL